MPLSLMFAIYPLIPSYDQLHVLYHKSISRRLMTLSSGKETVDIMIYLTLSSESINSINAFCKLRIKVNAKRGEGKCIIIRFDVLQEVN